MSFKPLGAFAAFALALLLIGVTTAPTPVDGPKLDFDTSAALAAAATYAAGLDSDALGDRMDGRCTEEEKKKPWWERLLDRIREALRRLRDRIRDAWDRLVEWLRDHCQPGNEGYECVVPM